MPPELIFKALKEAVSHKLAHFRGGGVFSKGEVYNSQRTIAWSPHNVGYAEVTMLDLGVIEGQHVVLQRRKVFLPESCPADGTVQPPGTP